MFFSLCHTVEKYAAAIVSQQGADRTARAMGVAVMFVMAQGLLTLAKGYSEFTATSAKTFARVSGHSCSWIALWRFKWD